MFPPHLPPPTSSIEAHRRLQRLKVLLVSTLFGLLAGIAGALMALGWIWPKVGEGDMGVFTSYRSVLTKVQLEDQVVRDLASQTMAVYSRGSVAGNVQSFNPKDFIAPALVVGNSDGWLVLYARRSLGAATQWRAVAESGRVYGVQKIVPDNYSGLVYLKVASLASSTSAVDEQFKSAVRFGDELQKLDDVFVLEHGSWQRSSVQDVFASSGAPHLDSAPEASLTLDRAFSPGDAVVATDGRLVGFTTGGASALSSAPLKYLWPSAVVGQSAVTYPSLGVWGWFSDEEPIVVNNERVVGFLVTQVLSRQSVLRRGDVVVAINGQPMTWSNLWLALSEKQLSVTIWRAGKMVEIVSPVVDL